VFASVPISELPVDPHFIGAGSRRSKNSKKEAKYKATRQIFIRKMYVKQKLFLNKIFFNVLPRSGYGSVFVLKSGSGFAFT
jgi:hypothetical protein